MSLKLFTFQFEVSYDLQKSLLGLWLTATADGAAKGLKWTEATR